MGAIHHQLQHNLAAPQMNNIPQAPPGASPDGGEETGPGTMVLTQLDQTCIRNRYHRLMLMSENGGVVRTYPLNRKQIHIGRSHGSNICIKDSHASVKHVTVNLVDGVCVATDHNSTNGTFINGERLDNFRILKDGDEIMIGKTIFQYASRAVKARAPESRESAPRGTMSAPGKAGKPGLPSNALRRIVTAFLMLAASMGIVFGVTDYLNKSKLPRLSSTGLNPSGSAAEIKETTPLKPFAIRNTPPHTAEPAVKKPLIDSAMEKYATGQINSAMRTLKAISVAVDNSPLALEARKMLMRLQVIKEIYRHALQAQEQKKFTLALQHWDSLLQVDKELVGSRPSFYAVQAGLNVQTISYNRALEAFHTKDHKKAKQLCQIILKIDSRNIDALNLLARIDAHS